jgi:hypothetical protein
MQDKAVLGKRYTCFKCGCKFYDLNKPEPFCPKCGADQREDPTPDPKIALLQKGSSRSPAKAAKAEPDVDIDEEAEFDLDDDMEEEEFAEGDIEEEEEPEEEAEEED